MEEVDLAYDPTSLCGPVDLRVARFLEEYRGNKLDPSYLRHVQKWHGGIPGKQYFDAEDGKTYRVGRFLTLVDKKSQLEPPPSPSWEFPERDARIDWSVLTLIDQEGPSCRYLFGGEELLPFAALYWGPHHPDGSELLLSPLDGWPETYREQGAWYFSKPFLTVEMVRHIYEHRPLTNELVAALTPDIVIEDDENPHMGVADLEDEITEIGYPE